MASRGARAYGGRDGKGLENQRTGNRRILHDFQRFLKKAKGSDRLKSGFLTLGNEINEGIRNNTWFSGVFMDESKLKK